MNFREQILVTIVDKLLIGALIAGLGLFFSMKLEHYKNIENISAEFAKERVRKIGEVETAMNEYEFYVAKVVPTALNEIDEMSIKKTGKPYSTTMQDFTESIKHPNSSKKHKKQPEAFLEHVLSKGRKNSSEISNIVRVKYVFATETIEHNRFWLGDELYHEYKSYLKNIAQYYELTIDTKETKHKMTDLKKEIEDSRMNIDKVLKIVTK